MTTCYSVCQVATVIQTIVEYAKDSIYLVVKALGG